ncbi:MAG: type II toxin-antitoxin system HipA family toxin [Crocinitomicaceae bacterium]
MIGEAERIVVSLKFGHSPIEVGEMVQDGRAIYFRYYPEFIKKGLEISPFKLPLTTGTFSADPDPFEGIHGVFNDSLPDGWGRLLTDRQLGNKGIPLGSITPLDRLRIVGDNGRGALMYEPKIVDESCHLNEMDVDDISTQVKAVLDGESGNVIEELVALGGSSGGARPKIFVGYNAAENQIIHGKENLSDDFEHWIIKFPSSIDYPDIAQIEMAYAQMARAAKIEMMPCKLFTGKSGKKYFGTQRFDRIGNNRLHLHSAAGLLHDDFRKSQLDYGHLLHNGYELTKKADTYEKIFRLAAFNIYSHNRDDHSNNFSFLMDKTGNWKFAPAYDLTYSASSHGMHSTAVAGESAKPGRTQLMELAEDFLIKKAKHIIKEVQEAISQWPDFARQSGVSDQQTKIIQKVLKGLKD